jgi:transposase
VTEDNVFYVGVDVSKAKHAIAIAEGGRDGKVRPSLLTTVIRVL